MSNSKLGNTEIESNSKTDEVSLSKADYHNWLEADLIEIEYLKRAGKILVYRKV